MSPQTVHWLGDDWFWTQHGQNRNRLVNTTSRILTVHQPQTLEDLIGGLERNYGWRNSTGGSTRQLELAVPPDDVVMALLREHPDFVVDDQGFVTSSHVLDPESLGPEKLTMVSVLREQPYCAMSRNDLVAACASEGMRSSTVQVFLTYAECIANYGHNVWGLRGVPVPEAVIDRLQDGARQTTRSFDRGLVEGSTAAGTPWFALRLAPAVLYSGVVSGKAGRPLPEGVSLALIDGIDGEQEGLLKRSSDFLYGFPRILRKHRAAAGDSLRVTMHVEDGYANVELGGEELLEAPGDW